MKDEKLEKKVIENANKLTLDDSEDMAFIEYQENVEKSKEAKRDRLVLISLTTAVYLLGLGLFATIVETIYQMNKIAGIVTGGILLVVYTICFIVLLVSIYSKHSFDLQFRRRKTGHFPERNNNRVRFEMARNIREQSFVLDYLDKKSSKEYLDKKEAKALKDFQTVISLAEKYEKSCPSYKSQDSKELAISLAAILSKDGIIYKKAKNVILTKAVATGLMTALSSNALVDMSIVAVKNMQMIKDLIWLYGFRPTNYEMNRIMLKVIRNLCISIGLNTLQGSTGFIASALKKSSDNFLVQLLSQAFTSGAQFLGNGTMTYLVGKYTIQVLLSQYHMQDLFRKQVMKDCELEMNDDTIREIDSEIQEEVKKLSSKKQVKEEEPVLIEGEKKKVGFFNRFISRKKKKEIQ